MRTLTVAWLLTGLLTLVVGTGLLWENGRIRECRTRVRALEQRRGDLQALLARNAQLQNRQPTEESRDTLRQQRAAAERERLHVNGLARQVAERTAPDRLTAGGALMPASLWRLSGRSTPRQALESVLWAISRGEVDHLSAALLCQPADQEKMAALFARLPSSAQARYGSPQQVLATMVAGNSPPDLSGVGLVTDPAESADQATMLVRLARESGATKDIYLQFQRNEAGWHLLVPPSVVASYARQIAGGESLPKVGFSDPAAAEP